MKRNCLLLLIVMFVVTVQSYATIAYPGLVEFKQPNGNFVKVIMRGSETLKWAETEDGYTLMYDSIGNLVYAELDVMGDLVPSNMIATDRDFRPAEVEMRLMSTPSVSLILNASSIWQSRCGRHVVNRWHRWPAAVLLQWERARCCSFW